MTLNHKREKRFAEIPERYVFTGDLAMACKFRGLGQRCLELFKVFLGFRELPTGKSKTYRFLHGLTIKCEATYRCFEVHIHYPKKRGGEAKKQECLCLPHFSIARVEAVTPAEPTAAFLKTGRFKYDISICAKDMYLSYRNAYDANFGRYYVGQIVLATIGAEMDEWELPPLDCDRFCLVQRPRFTTLAISPVHVTAGKMKKWIEVEKR